MEQDELQMIVAKLQSGLANDGEQLMAATHIIQNEMYEDFYSHCANLLYEHTKVLKANGRTMEVNLPQSVQDCFEFLIKNYCGVEDKKNFHVIG